MPVNHRHQLRRHPAAQRRRAVPRPGGEVARRARPSATPTGRRLGVGHLEAGRRPRSSSLAAGLLALGIEPEQRVGIASGTRYEWILADLAVMCAGGATTTVYPSHQRRGHGVHPQRLRVPGGLRRGRRADRQAHDAQGRAAAPSTKVVTFDGTADGDWVIGLDDLAELGERLPRRAPRRHRRRPPRRSRRDQLATLIYTSGTTGRPKGVRLRHRSWVYEGAAIQAQDILERGRPAVPLAADGALVRQGAAVHPARLRLRRPPSTAGSTRSSTTSAS